MWKESDFESCFCFSELLDCKHVDKDTNLQARLGEQVFIQNNTMWKRLGFTPHQMVLGLSTGVPGVYDIPEGNNNTHFARSLKRIKEGLAKNQVAPTRPHPTLGGSFPYKPGDAFHFLGSMGRISLGCVAKYRIAHSGTRSTILASDFMSPTEKTRKDHAKRAALSPVLKTIRDKKMMKVSLKIYWSKRSACY